MNELFLEHRLTLSWEMKNDALVEKVSEEEGAGLRLIHDDKTTSYWSGSIATIIPRAIKRGLDYQNVPEFCEPALLLEPESLKATAENVKNLYSVFSECGLLEPEITFTHNIQQIQVTTPNLTAPISDLRVISRLILRAIAQTDRRQVIHLDVLNPEYPLNINTDNMFSLTHTFRKRALEKANTTRMPGDINTFVLSSGEVGILVHEVGHLFEGDQPGIAAWLDRKVGSTLVTLVDDPTMPGLAGSMKIDDEGQICSKTTLLAEGRLINLAHCTDSTTKGSTRTAHARRESYKHLPLPRLSNTYLAPGQSRAVDIVANTKRGVYVAEFAHCRLEPRSRCVQGMISLGYLIENGILTQPCSGPFNFSVRDFLQSIDAVADDLQVISGKGLCGKRGQIVPVGYGLPTVRLQGLKPLQS